ncbi:hypothetical protein JS531_04475 [Bifidobacterium sp. CP2]|uniref:hypothetical protein n=1 Tax=Bifidobacterium TaxID=1678 RepID=UPI001BDD375E|nr:MULTISPECIES: hypothetical protein [Bifidobacterium]MBT1181239.1 hypothetical protein [Bifidobacterium sp. CP2]MBW3079923.1 hypothetical protein [Bifidobacterium saguinibicoloris]
MEFITIDSTFDHDSRAQGVPEGVRVRITRLTPHLDYDVAVTVPEGMLPAEKETSIGALIVGGAMVHHRSFRKLDEAERWALDFTDGLRRSGRISRSDR